MGKCSFENRKIIVFITLKYFIINKICVILIGENAVLRPFRQQRAKQGDFYDCSFS